MNSNHDLGRRYGVWISEGEIEAYMANGWTIADHSPSRGEVLMAPPADEQERAA